MEAVNTIEQNLAQFYGSECLYRYGMFKTLYITDGVKYLAEAASAFWLVDAIESYQPSLARKRNADTSFQVWKLQVAEDSTAVLTCDDGNDNILVRQEISYTDFPLKSIKLYAVRGRDMDGSTYMTVLLPTEY